MSTLSHSFSFSPNTSISSSQVNQNNLDTRTWANGGIENDNIASTAAIAASKLATATKEQLGLNDGTTVRRGKSIIATEESRTNTAYGTLTTPDQVTGVVLPTDGLIVVAFQAQIKSSVSSAGRAAIFLGANQLKTRASGSPALEAGVSIGADTYGQLTSCPFGLCTLPSSTASDVTTGQAVGFMAVGATVSFELGASYTTVSGTDSLKTGGVCHVFAAAGTYTISVQFAATSGSVTAKERKLWVEARGF